MSYLTPEIEQKAIEAVAKKLLPKVMEWLEQSGDSFDEADIEADLIKVLDSHDLDGYSLAKELDDWSPNAELVEVLDDASHLISKAEKNLVRQRLIDENIMPKLAKGQTIKLPVRFAKESKRDKSQTFFAGVITEIDTAGQYLVNSTEAGHIDPDNNPEGRCGTTGVYVYWNVLEAANPELLLQPTQNSDIV